MWRVPNSILPIAPLIIIAAATLVYGLLAHTELLSGGAALRLEAEAAVLPADGYTTTLLHARTTDGRALTLREAKWEIVEGDRRARIESIRRSSEGLTAVLSVGVLPGRVVVEARAKRFTAARAELELELLPYDRFEDGTPDFLRLDSTLDREAFRRWFSFLAEAQYFRAPKDLPLEISDCAGLVRFAYRESLREHSAGWAAEIGLDARPPGESVEKYRYPFTPLGASLFRVRSGPFQPEDLGDGTFAQFADARTLRGLNSHFVSRDISLAQPGDLLFFRQLEQDLPFHMMIFVGPSHFESGETDWLVYHTGPIGDGPGEVRRVRVEELQRHPSARWRPFPGNPNFLGVYRWNILRSDR